MISLGFLFYRYNFKNYHPLFQKMNLIKTINNYLVGLATASPFYCNQTKGLVDINIFFSSFQILYLNKCVLGVNPLNLYRHEPKTLK